MAALEGSLSDRLLSFEPSGLEEANACVEFDLLATEICSKVQGRKGRIKVLAANPRTARSFSGDLLLHEFAFQQDDIAIWEAAEPILSINKDFLCRIASTGNGCDNIFGSSRSRWNESRSRFWCMGKSFGPSGRAIRPTVIPWGCAPVGRLPQAFKQRACGAKE